MHGGGGWPVCRQRDHPGRLGKRWPWPVAGQAGGGTLGEMVRPPGTCTAQVASVCLSVIVDSDSSIGSSSTPALSDEVSEDQRVEEFVPGHGADQEVSQSSSPGVLTPRPPASCSSFLSLCQNVSLAPSFPPLSFCSLRFVSLTRSLAVSPLPLSLPFRVHILSVLSPQPPATATVWVCTCCATERGTARVLGRGDPVASAQRGAFPQSSWKSFVYRQRPSLQSL